MMTLRFPAALTPVPTGPSVQYVTAPASPLVNPFSQNPAPSAEMETQAPDRFAVQDQELLEEIRSTNLLLSDPVAYEHQMIDIALERGVDLGMDGH